MQTEKKEGKLLRGDMNSYIENSKRLCQKCIRAITIIYYKVAGYKTNTQS